MIVIRKTILFKGVLRYAEDYTVVNKSQRIQLNAAFVGWIEIDKPIREGFNVYITNVIVFSSFLHLLKPPNQNCDSKEMVKNTPDR